MKIKTFPTIEDWMTYRRGLLTGSKVKDCLPKKNGGAKIGKIRLVAELVSNPASEESQMNIGRRLESEALARYQKETGKKVNTSLAIWQRDEVPQIAYSPDGYIDSKKIEIAQEVKCLSAERHLEVFFSQEIPTDYWEQTRWAFVTNDALKQLDVIFYCPLIPAKDYFVITIKRKDIEAEIEELRKAGEQVLSDVSRMVGDLTF